MLETPWGKLRCFQSMKPSSPLTRVHFPDREQGITGKLVCALYVSAKGVVKEVKVVTSSGNAALDDEAARMLRSATFEPFVDGAGPIEFVTLQPIEFSI